MPGAHEWAQGSAPDSAAAANTHSEVLGELGPVHRAVPAEPRGGRHLRGAAPPPRAGSSTWSRSGPAPGDPAAYVGQVVADPLGERLRQLAAGAVVGEHLVAARPLDGGRQRPGAGDLHLEVPGVALERLLEHVEVLAEQAAGPPLVAARRRAGQPPARGLEVGAELGDDGQRPARHRGGGAALGELGQVRQVGQLADDDAHGLGRVGPGKEPTPVARVMPVDAGDASAWP